MVIRDPTVDPDMPIDKYMQIQFRELASAMWQSSDEMHPMQLRDCVRMFVAGAFVFDQCRTPDLETLVNEIAEEKWMPGEGWHFGPTSQRN
jgi:hypothetical protein